MPVLSLGAVAARLQIGRAPRRDLRWAVVVALGAVASATLAVGLGLALSGGYGERLQGPAEAAPDVAEVFPRGAAYRVVALGDSLSAGTGDLRAGGYPGRLQRLLEARGRTTSLLNLAVPGAETNEVLARLSEPSVRAAVRQANVILVSAGGNDLSHSLRPVTGRALDDPERAREGARANLTAILAALRALNAAAPIRLVGLYNPFDVTPAEEPSARALLASWNALLEAAVAAQPGALVIPTADLFYGRPDRLAGDHYHPGARGQALIAERVLQTLPEGDAPP
jgi:lysophospholipase L1-like esterase